MNFIKKGLLTLTFIAAITLASCGEEAPKSDKIFDSINALTAETDTNITNKLDLVYKDGVYGNVYLPDNIDGKSITWRSSNEKILRTTANGSIAPGEVNRPNSDTTVKLLAKIGDGDNATKYEQEVLVKAAPYELQDDDFEAYLFCHFIGEGTGKTEGDVKIATGEQIFFALANVGQGLHFKDMNGSTQNNPKPVLTSALGERGVRDPYICRSPEGDTFYIVATDLSVYTRGGWNNNAGQATKTGSHSVIFWESHDLVNWTEERMLEVALPNAGMAWAPEMTYCEETGEYLIFFSSTILDDYANGVDAKILKRDSIYFTATRDFVHFSETKQFIDNQPYPEGYTNREETDQYATNNDHRKIIDGSVMKIGDYYYSAAKDGGNNENHGGVLIQRTTDLYDPESWEKVMNLADAGFQAEGRNADNKCLEGPAWFILNKADRQDPDTVEIGLMADFYANTSIGYIPWTTTDIEDTTNANNSWRRIEKGNGDGQFSWDSQTKRHGGILRITADEAELLKENFPIAE